MRFNRFIFTPAIKYKNHRKVWKSVYGEIPKGMVIDHINGNTLDNRIENLQCITQKQNIQRSPLKQGYVYKRGKWWYGKRTINKVTKKEKFGSKCGAYLFSVTAFLSSR